MMLRMWIPMIQMEAWKKDVKDGFSILCAHVRKDVKSEIAKHTYKYLRSECAKHKLGGHCSTEVLTKCIENCLIDEIFKKQLKAF